MGLTFSNDTHIANAFDREIWAVLSTQVITMGPIRNLGIGNSNFNTNNILSLIHFAVDIDRQLETQTVRILPKQFQRIPRHTGPRSASDYITIFYIDEDSQQSIYIVNDVLIKHDESYIVTPGRQICAAEYGSIWIDI